jgi:hypothetical protein
MNEQKYLTHLIKFHASQMPGDKYWIGKAEVRYNDGQAFRSFEVHGPSEKFISRNDAEQYIIQTAKKLIDKFI